MQNDRFSEFEQTLNAIKYKVAFEKLELIKTLNELSNVFEYDLIHASDFLDEYNKLLEASKYNHQFRDFLYLENYLYSNVSTMKLALKAKRLRIEFNFRKIQIELNKLEIFYINQSANFDEIKNIDEKIVIEFINSLAIYENKIIETLRLDRELDDNYLVTELI